MEWNGSKWIAEKTQAVSQLEHILPLIHLNSLIIKKYIHGRLHLCLCAFGRALHTVQRSERCKAHIWRARAQHLSTSINHTHPHIQNHIRAHSRTLPSPWYSQRSQLKKETSSKRPHSSGVGMAISPGWPFHNKASLSHRLKFTSVADP